jgi:hypothetical protein
MSKVIHEGLFLIKAFYKCFCILINYRFRDLLNIYNFIPRNMGLNVHILTKSKLFSLSNQKDILNCI